MSEEYRRLAEMEEMAAGLGHFRDSIIDLTEWQHEQHEKWRDARDAGLPHDHIKMSWRDADTNFIKNFYEERGWHTVSTSGARGYLGPRFFQRLEKVLLRPSQMWTLVPIEMDWTVVFAFRDPDDAEMFRDVFRAR